ncbi:MAG: DUF2804 domain-containing protein [Clostridia bacterium]|nr:DUF2804 domain-containing protein [Clostridia bacterium]
MIKLTPGKLLDEKGHLTQAGWATSLVKEYNRKDVKANAMRIKEWDYYIVTNGKYAVALTIDDNSYMSMGSVSFLDFEKPSYITKSQIHLFSWGKVGFPSSLEEGDLHYKDDKISIDFYKTESQRRLVCSFLDFKNGAPFSCDVTLCDFPKDYMVIATPFPKKKKAFYYNAKVNCMTAEGWAKIGSEEYIFDKKDSLGTLDWGRGVWTYKNTWYWGSMQTRIDDGKTFGWNIGYGFGDTSSASEDMLFYDGVAHKLGRTTFHIPQKDGKDDFLSPWTFTCDDNRFYMEFVPIIDRYDNTDLVVLCSKQHQVFGKFTGWAILDDGTKIEIKDKIGFAEKVFNKW